MFWLKPLCILMVLPQAVFVNQALRFFFARWEAVKRNSRTRLGEVASDRHRIIATVIFQTLVFTGIRGMANDCLWERMTFIWRPTKTLSAPWIHTFITPFFWIF
jgi:hypothetical protein